MAGAVGMSVISRPTVSSTKKLNLKRPQMQSSEQTEPIIVGDIGGTHGRLGVAHFPPGQALPRIEQLHIYMSADYQGLDEMLEAFLDDLKSQTPIVARLAIAGPTSDRVGHLTNLGWPVDAGELEGALGLENVALLNDFGALALAAAHLRAPHVVRLKEGASQSDKPISVMGPGTGFGVALLAPCRGQWTVVPTEGGHTNFSPTTDLEYELARFLGQGGKHVSTENVLCGDGLVRIYRFLALRSGGEPATCSPAEVGALALANPDSLWRKATLLFLAILGGAAGDIALVHGATGGVCFGGGVLPKIADLIPESDLVERFVEKGPMKSYLQDIPIDLIVSQDAALIGAAIAHLQEDAAN